jgi:chromate transport protein ChrA
VDYGARQEYELAQEFWFRIFKGIVLLVWVMIMFSEYKEIVKFISLCVHFPNAADFGQDYVLVEADPSDPEDVRYRLQGITGTHRMATGILCLLRVILTSFLLIVGMSYIVKTNSYPDLLMNGVALGFVAEISAVLYAQILREEIRDQTEDIKAIKVPMFGLKALNQYPALLDIILLAFLIAFCYFVMEWQLTGIVKPIYRALECTCLNTGPECFEAQKHDHAFWNNYWYKTVPWIYDEIAKLKAALPAGATAFAASQAGSVLATSLATSTQSMADAKMPVDVSLDKNVGGQVSTLESEDVEMHRKLSKLQETLDHSHVSHKNFFGSHHSL